MCAVAVAVVDTVVVGAFTGEAVAVVGTVAFGGGAAAVVCAVVAVGAVVCCTGEGGTVLAVDCMRRLKRSDRLWKQGVASVTPLAVVAPVSTNMRVNECTRVLWTA